MVIMATVLMATVRMVTMIMVTVIMMAMAMAMAIVMAMVMVMVLVIVLRQNCSYSSFQVSGEELKHWETRNAVLGTESQLTSSDY